MLQTVKLPPGVVVQREYNDKLKTGDLLEVAQVLRDLYQISSEKELSYGEKTVTRAGP